MRLAYGDIITLIHPNGDRIGPRKITGIRQAGGATSTLVENVGDVAVVNWNPPRSTDQGRYLEHLLSAGWVIESVNGTGLIKESLSETEELAQQIAEHQFNRLGECACGGALPSYGKPHHDPREIAVHIARAILRARK